MLIHSGVSVILKIDSRNDPVSHGKSRASDWVSKYVNDRLHCRQSSKMDGSGSLIEVRILDFHDRQVTITADKLHLSDVLLWIVFLLDDNQSTVTHHVRVGENPVPIDHKSRSDSDGDIAGAPRHPIVGIL